MRNWGARARAAVVLGIFCSFVLGGGETGWAKTTPAGKSARLKLEPVAFSRLTGWAKDDHRAAFVAFRRSCRFVVKQSGGTSTQKRLRQICQKALARKSDLSQKAARAFFERHFSVYRILPRHRYGRLTGYYEPILRGSRTKSARFPVPIYKKPPELVRLTRAEQRKLRRQYKLKKPITWAKRTARGLEPYPTRKEIEKGHLEGRGLELVYLANPVDAFFLHVQGSGRIQLEDGKTMRIGFAAKNGYPFTSIGKSHIQKGLLTPAAVSRKAMYAWLAKSPKKARELMWENESFIFFRKLSSLGADSGPIGAMGVPLTPGRSLAVDRRYHRLGLPIWISSQGRGKGNSPLRRLMIAQDEGSAIRGVQRGDVFWGSGKKAGRLAEKTFDRVKFFLLLPKRAPQEENNLSSLFFSVFR